MTRLSREGVSIAPGPSPRGLLSAPRPASTQGTADIAGLLQGCPKLLGQREEEILFGRDDFLNGAVALVGKQAQHVLHQHLGYGGPGRYANRCDTFKPGFINFIGKIHPVGGLGTVFEGNLHQPHGV